MWTKNFWSEYSLRLILQTERSIGITNGNVKIHRTTDTGKPEKTSSLWLSPYCFLFNLKAVDCEHWDSSPNPGDSVTGGENGPQVLQRSGCHVRHLKLTVSSHKEGKAKWGCLPNLELNLHFIPAKALRTVSFGSSNITHSFSHTSFIQTLAEWSYNEKDGRQSIWLTRWEKLLKAVGSG